MYEDNLIGHYHTVVEDPVIQTPTEIDLHFSSTLGKNGLPVRCRTDSRCRKPALPWAKACWEHLPDSRAWLRKTRREFDHRQKTAPKIEGKTFIGCQLPSMHLRNVEFAACLFVDIQIPKVAWRDIVFSSSEIRGAQFSGSLIKNITLTDTVLDCSRFTNCRIDGVSMKRSTIVRSVAFLAGTELAGSFGNMTFDGLRIDSDVLLQDVSFENVIFSEAKMDGVDLSACQFAGNIKFEGDCDLRGTSFPESAKELISFSSLDTKGAGIIFKEPSPRVESTWMNPELDSEPIDESLDDESVTSQPWLQQNGAKLLLKARPLGELSLLVNAAQLLIQIAVIGLAIGLAYSAVVEDWGDPTSSPLGAFGRGTIWGSAAVAIAFLVVAITYFVLPPKDGDSKLPTPLV